MKNLEEDKKERLRQYNKIYYSKNKERRQLINERYWKKKLEGVINVNNNNKKGYQCQECGTTFLFQGDENQEGYEDYICADCYIASWMVCKKNGKENINETRRTE